MVLGHHKTILSNTSENIAFLSISFLYSTLAAEWNRREMGTFLIILPKAAALIFAFLKVEWNGGHPFPFTFSSLKF